MDKTYDILIVDDDNDMRDSLRLILENSGFSVRSAPRGEVALTEIHHKVPDLVILDIMMTTDTEGVDLAYELKHTAGLENLPIILLTSFLEKVREDGPEQFQHVLGQSWPAKWLFEKPVNPEKLINKIHDILAA
ncbi:MAG: response regulator [Candidatus Zixiibacteriota bacterium]